MPLRRSINALRRWFNERQADRDHVPPRPVFAESKIWHPEDLAPALRERPLANVRFVVFDTETTGLQPSRGDELVSIGAVRVLGGKVAGGETFDSLIRPNRRIPKRSTRIHGITDDMVADASDAATVLVDFKRYARDDVLVAHNAAFDMKFLHLNEDDAGVRFDNPVLDTLLLSAFLEPDSADHSLDALIRRWEISADERHSALSDALATAELLVRLIGVLRARGIDTLGQVYRETEMHVDMKRLSVNF